MIVTVVADVVAIGCAKRARRLGEGRERRGKAGAPIQRLAVSAALVMF
jgi:hypothetical protein